ncbi:hypothetical protein H3146_27455 [Streptomyces sp. OF3]|uniref:Pycsar effector protein domain-containing protein n=1 Tax=Streptomyces alkaliterrae TaxID=2213162 RepID=A0A5P0YYJ6_9ACTN|nr:hypothetical protein [Streptomyces alkaliterrae]MBB1260935.1 hypothetical protein [Streptomyces alkaliterrae]MQS05376.1 hypothetical protein [Streptomyces alkaliterrae]
MATAQRLLDELRGEVARADSKASVLLGAIGMTVGTVTSVLTGRSWGPGRLAVPAQIVWWAGAGCLLLALGSLLMAVLPRYRDSRWQPGRPLTYFADIRRAAADGRLRDALADTERAPLDSLAASLGELSRIVSEKHRWVRAGLLAFCLGVPLLCVPMLAG